MTSHCNISSLAAEPVLVIGGRGFVGSHVTRALIASGCHPHLFGPPMEQDLLADLTKQFTEHQGSVEDMSVFIDVLTTSKAHKLVVAMGHSVGRSGLMRSGEEEANRALAINVAGFRNVLEAAHDARVDRVVWTSSTVVYGDSASYVTQPVDEDAPTRPLTFYGLTKLMAEEVAAYYRRRYALDIVGLRLPLVVGPGLWYQGAASAITQLMDAAREGKDHTVEFHDDPMDLMHVTDVARAVLAVIAEPGPCDGLYNINGFSARLSDIAAGLARRNDRFDATISHQDAALQFPAINDRRFRERFTFSPGFELDRMLDTMISKEPDRV